MGGGTTTIGVFFDGNLIFADYVPVGGGHVTNDIARGLSTPVAHAERMKTLFGSAISASTDEREMIAVPQIGEEDDGQVNHVPKSLLVGIIAPRIEETFELVRNRLEASGFDKVAGRRVVLTGGRQPAARRARVRRPDPRQAGAHRPAAADRRPRRGDRRPGLRHDRAGCCISRLSERAEVRRTAAARSARATACSRPLGSLAEGELLRQIRLCCSPGHRVSQRGGEPGPDRVIVRGTAAVEDERMINLSIPKDEHEMKPRITVVGVGGAGGNAVNNMIRSNLIGVRIRRLQHRRAGAAAIERDSARSSSASALRAGSAPARGPMSGAPQPKRRSTRSSRR